MRKKKGFTLIELLVVIAIIAMLLAILMPALGKVKKLAMRLVCGTNVKGLGTAMNVYAFDYDDEFPRQGGTSAMTWSESMNTNKVKKSNLIWNSDYSGEVTIGSCLYMLVREADVSPKSFICPASSDVEYKISEDRPTMTDANINDLELTDLWDFGCYPAGGWDGNGDGDGHDSECHYSYSYQQVYTEGTSTTTGRAYPPDASGNASRVVLADKSPYCDVELTLSTDDWSTSLPDNWNEYVHKIDYTLSSSDPLVQLGNSNLHDREGQNVLYNDGHNEFAKRPDVSINNDNIYARKGGDNEKGRRNGNPPTAGGTDITGFWANGSNDTILVSDSVCMP